VELPNKTATAAALAIWEHAGDLRGTAGELYLNRRGLQIAGNEGNVLRFHAELQFDGHRVAALVALFRDVVTDEPTGIQRIFLQKTGERIGRRMLGRVRGAAVKIDDDGAVAEGLHIGEGLESCLAARALGFRPVWAVGSAGGIRNFPVLPGIGALSILRETDDQGANEHATNACAERWLAASREVLAVTPMLVGDMNDVALRCAHLHDHHDERHIHAGGGHDQ
jgi:putative DNA primase/helicase